MSFLRFCVLFSICCVLSIICPCTSANSSAKERGMRLASDLWDEGFSCEDIESFRIEAGEELVEQCQEDFDPIRNFVTSCIEGVLEIIVDKEEPCVFDLEQCSRIGEGIGRSATRQLCELSNENEAPVFSRRCVLRIVMSSIEATLKNLEENNENGSCED